MIIRPAETEEATVPTIEDVARLAGVSKATVSRALHSPDLVAKTTRAAVTAAIDAIGYTQNVAAQSLRRRKADAVLVLVPDIGNTFFSEVLAGIDHVASAAGITVLIGNTVNDPVREDTYLRYLFNGRSDGIVLLNGRLPAWVGERARAVGRHLPAVSISEAIDEADIPHVGIDNIAAARGAVAYLISLGHKRIAHVCGPVGNIHTGHRLAGYRAALADAHIDHDESLLIAGDFSAGSGARAAAVLQRMRARPTAVFCANDEMAMGLIAALHTAGVAVPRDLSVVGFDDIHFSQSYVPAITTVRQPRFELGRRAMTVLLAQQLDRLEALARVQLLESEFVVRDSAAPAPRP